MKKTIFKFVLIISVITFISCTGYGKKLQYEATEVYYTDKVDKKDAEKLGEYLVSTDFANSNKKSVQLTKDEKTKNYVFRMVASEEAMNNKTYEIIFKAFAKKISDSVFNSKPVDFHICDNTFKTIKSFPFDENEFK